MPIDRRSAAWSAALVSCSAAGLMLLRGFRASRDRSLTNKVVLITGGSRGLGFALARELASRGARLILTARGIAGLESAKERLIASGDIASSNVFVYGADVTSVSDVQQLVAAATQHFGQIDVVINNAGVIMVGPVESQTLDSFHQAMDINFYGALHTTLAVLPQMLARGDGAIVNIASIGGKVAFPHLLPYVASKFAVVGWSQGLRAELAAKGIRVTTVNPGIMRTGSYIQARYTGDTQKEFNWFAAGGTLPLSATNASAAARKIVRGLINNSAEIGIGLQAIVASRLVNVSPELSAVLLQAANAFLPDAPAASEQNPATQFWEADRSIPGKAYRGSLPGVLEHFGNRSIDRYNQEPATGMRSHGAF